MWVKGQRVRAGVYRFKFSEPADPEEMLFVFSGLGCTLTPEDYVTRVVETEIEITLSRQVSTGGGFISLHAFSPRPALSRKPKIQPPKSSS